MHIVDSDHENNFVKFEKDWRFSFWMINLAFRSIEVNGNLYCTQHWGSKSSQNFTYFVSGDFHFQWIINFFTHKWQLTVLNDGFGNNGHYKWIQFFQCMNWINLNRNYSLLWVCTIGPLLLLGIVSVSGHCYFIW